jgi:stress-induced-phosphoprotein 1
VKGYIRKSNILFAMRDYTKAIEAIQQAEEHDSEHKHKSEIQQQLYKCQQALFTQREGESEEDVLQRAMRDPEIAVGFYPSCCERRFDFFFIQGIMNDPVMQQILQQAQNSPGALQEHMKNTAVRQKIMKLVNAGIIKTR